MGQQESLLPNRGRMVRAYLVLVLGLVLVLEFPTRHRQAALLTAVIAAGVTRPQASIRTR